MSQPKVVVIGAGSYFFGRPAIWAMLTSEILREGTLVLVDTNPQVLQTMMTLAQRVKTYLKTSTEIIGSTNYRDVLADADFIILTFSDRGVHFRGMDVEIAAKHGVRMCSADTIGPGGIFRAVREIPEALRIAHDAEVMAPAAWLINFVNPSTVMGITLSRFSNMRSFAICDGPHEPFYRLSFLRAMDIVSDDVLEIPAEVETKLQLDIIGINHFTWMTKFVYDGKDYLPLWQEKIAAWAKEEQEKNAYLSKGGKASDNNADAKARYNTSYAHDLMKLFGAYPTCIAHTKEYVPYYQGIGIAPIAPEPIGLFDADTRATEVAAHMAETEGYAMGTLPLENFLKAPHFSCISRYPDTPMKIKGDHATDIIESMWGKLGRSFYINTTNRGAVSNMNDDAFLELRCHADMQGITPVASGSMPRGLQGLQQQVLDSHELTACAAATFDRDLLLRALVTDPIINNIADARAIMDEMFARQRDAMDPRWYAAE